jgi:DNA-directed RNA polymerase specialized sigma24 family protein
MARIEWVKHRLDNWALWKEREKRGGLGFATVSVLLANRVDQSRDTPLPVDETDAQATDLAVESLKLGRGHLYVTLYHIYIDGIGVRETARRMARAESTVKANLDQADHALSEWFGAKAEMDAAKKKAMEQKRSFTT